MDAVISLVIMLNFIVNGIFIANWLLRDEKYTVRLAFGAAFGIGLMMWLPALASFVFGFTVVSQITAMAAALLFGIVAVLKTGSLKPKKPLTAASVLTAFCYEKHLVLTVLPLFALTCYLLNTHILPMNENGSLMSGQSTYGDMAMHMSIITSISVQKSFPPTYNLITGNIRLGYPFLCDSISSTLYTVGARIRTAYIIPMIFAVLSLFSGLFVFFEEWLKDKIKAVCSTVLFLIGGGFGFVYFFEGTKLAPGNFTRIFTGYYTTPTNNVDANVKWVNVIADLLIPQRATLFGWTLLVPAMFLLYKTAFCGDLDYRVRRRYFILLGVIAGSLPLVHTHSFLALAVLSAVYLLYSLIEKNKVSYWFVYAGIALVLSSWQLFMFTFQQASGEQFLRRQFNWANSMDNYFWFYIKNIGLPYLLIIPALLNADKKNRWFYAGGLVIVLIAEIIVFQPNEYDNNKLLYIWHLLTCGLVAGYAVDVFRKMRQNVVRGLTYYTCMVVIVCNISGVLTLGREAVSSYDIFDREHIEAAEYIKRTTAPDSLFLTSSNHNNTVASLTGRNIFCGSSAYLYFHGINYMGYELMLEELYKRPTMEKVKSSGIDYVFISDYEAMDYKGIDVDFYSDNFVEVFKNNTIVIYAVSERSINRLS